MKITIIGGGVMGEIFAKSLSKQNENLEITVIDKNQEKLDKFSDYKNIKTSLEISDNLVQSDVLILAVKPQSFNELAKELKEKIKEQSIVLSIMAGISLDNLKSNLGVKKIVRSMPNIGAKFNKSITGWVENGLNREEKEKIKNILKSIGDELYFEDEFFINKTTAVSGSGPGFLFALIEKWVDETIKLGFSKEQAEKLIFSTVDSSNLLLQAEKNPKKLKEKVASKGGTTEAGLEKIDKYAGKMWKKTLRSAFKRAQELS